MKPSIRDSFSVSLDDSRVFSRLSGDYNPLHIDPTAARRTQFGGTVTHGLHLFLRSLEEISRRGLLDRREPARISALFKNPVLTGASLDFLISIENERLRLQGESAGQPAFSGTIELTARTTQSVVVEDAEFELSRPQEVAFPPIIRKGSVPLKLSRALLRTLFPSLANLEAACWITDLLATTQIIGVRCPGMHSIYSGFRLHREVAQDSPQPSMFYQVDGMENRIRMLRIQVTGAVLSGTVEALFRARPVAQLPMRSILSNIKPDEFANHRALVVGGSRGIGELTAKIVAAGGADVTITYAQGKEDAELICAEARELGRLCTARQLDVTTLSMQSAPEWIAQSNFSHIYFFASPFISQHFGSWNEALFLNFSRVYVTAFSALAEHTLASRADQDLTVHFLYPSSVFVTQPELGFAEYAVAKAAGEAVCDQLSRLRGARFVKPRLPRLRTDQTSALPDTSVTNPFLVMLNVVRTLHSSSRQ